MKSMNIPDAAYDFAESPQSPSTDAGRTVRDSAIVLMASMVGLLLENIDQLNLGEYEFIIVFVLSALGFWINRKTRNTRG